MWTQLFILFFGLSSNTIIISLLNCFRFGYWELFPFDSCIVTHFQPLSTFSFSGIKSLHSHLAYSLGQPWNQSLLHKPWFFLYCKIDLGTQIWGLDVLIVTGVSLLLGLQTESGNTCIILTCTCTHTHIYFCIYLHGHIFYKNMSVSRYFWAQSGNHMVQSSHPPSYL